MDIWSYAGENFASGACNASFVFGLPLLLCRLYGSYRARQAGREYLGWWLFLIGLALLVTSSGFFYVGLDVVDSPVSTPEEQDQGWGLALSSLLGFGCGVVLLIASWVPRVTVDVAES